MPENRPNSSDKAASVKKTIFQNCFLEYIKAKMKVSQIIFPYRINKMIGLIEKQLVKNRREIKIGVILRIFEINDVFNNCPIKNALISTKAIII